MFVVITLLCAILSLFAWQVKRAAWQKRCVEAIRERGGSVDYGYRFASGMYDPQAKSQIPEWLRCRLGDDFFHRVARVHLVELEPLGWKEREGELWPRINSSGRCPMSAEDCTTLALHQLHVCGGDDVDFCYQRALLLDPHCTEANLILAGRLLEKRDDPKTARPYLEAALRDSSPDSLEHAHAQKLLAGEKWTFDELCQRVGPDGVLR